MTVILEMTLIHTSHLALVVSQRFFTTVSYVLHLVWSFGVGSKSKDFFHFNDFLDGKKGHTLGLWQFDFQTGVTG